MGNRNNIRVWSTIFMAFVLVLSLSGQSLAANPLESILGNQDTMMGNQTSMMGGQNTMMGNQTSMMGTLDSIMERLDHIPPSWSQKIAASERFELVLDNGAVLDKETGLVWERNLTTISNTWNASHSYCNNLSVGDRKGWRLPKVHELASLVDTTESSPALPSDHPFNDVINLYYWSSTDSVLNADLNALVVSMNNGIISNRNKTTSPSYVWCVRGGQAVDSPSLQ